MISGLKKHALVVLIAVLVATYQMYRLESQRTRRGVEVEEEFEHATRLLQSQLSFQTSAAAAGDDGGGGGVGKYEVRVTQALHGKHKSAIVINRAHTVPRIEAELFVDQQLVGKRKQQHKSHKKPRKGPAGAGKAAAKAADANDFSVLRLRIYDYTTMDAVAKVQSVH